MEEEGHRVPPRASWEHLWYTVPPGAWHAKPQPCLASYFEDEHETLVSSQAPRRTLNHKAGRLAHHLPHGSYYIMEASSSSDPHSSPSFRDWAKFLALHAANKLV